MTQGLVACSEGTVQFLSIILKGNVYICIVGDCLVREYSIILPVMHALSIKHNYECRGGRRGSRG
jgi:hypothetical protein